uniref:Mpv17-like protein 2 n=1 Tax=Phallusia mammillata TaxID=59560 RepID=A0A6F9DLV2_9ASCI|nr:mpv17-like protein 2 [Phallusia mammillata]
MSYGEESDKPSLQTCWKAYMMALKKKPVLTKAVTSGVIGMAGNLTAQLINLRSGEIDALSIPTIARYGAFGVLITGPVVHLFYKWLDAKFPPSKDKESHIKRFFVERLLLAPFFSFAFHAFMAALQYKSIAPTVMTVRAYFWPTLMMNWKYWTVLQFIIVNYVPRDLKPLFGGLCGLLWNIMLSTGILQTST